MTRTLSLIACMLTATALTVSAQMTHVSMKDAMGMDGNSVFTGGGTAIVGHAAADRIACGLVTK